MSMIDAIARTIKRLNVKGVITDFGSTGLALYRGIATEFNRVKDYYATIAESSVPNNSMSNLTIDDYESKYGITSVNAATDTDRIGRIIERASENGNGGADWLEEQIQKAGFQLYVHVNERIQGEAPQFADFQFGLQVQFGAQDLYQDPRLVPGELLASSPSGNIGPQFLQFGDFQFGTQVQFGTLDEDFANPRPIIPIVPADPSLWGYVFFLSPFEDRLATNVELLPITVSEWAFLKRMLLQTKFTRNWCVVQVTTATLQDTITTDGLTKLTTDEFTRVVSSNI